MLDKFVNFRYLYWHSAVLLFSRLLLSFMPMAFNKYENGLRELIYLGCVSW